MRAALALTLLALAPGAWAEDAARTWSFRVYLDDAEIGTHVFTLTRQGDAATLRSEAHFKVKFLFVNAYRYDHTAEETWRGDCLSAMTARTNDGGEKLFVDAVSRDGGLEVRTRASQRSLTGCVMSFAYWDPRMLAQRRLLNAQTGDYDPVEIEDRGKGTITVAGKPLAARLHRLTGEKLKIDLWYSPEGEWLGLESTTESGKRLRYRLQSAPGS